MFYVASCPHRADVAMPPGVRCLGRRPLWSSMDGIYLMITVRLLLRCDPAVCIGSGLPATVRNETTTVSVRSLCSRPRAIF